MRLPARLCIPPLLVILAACDAGAPPEGERPAPTVERNARTVTIGETTPAGDSLPRDGGTQSAFTDHPLPPTARAPSPHVELTGPGHASPQALQTGREILPLTRVLQIATAAVPGEVIEVELDEDDDDDDIPEYELKILTPQGRSIEVKIDARRGTILEIEED